MSGSGHARSRIPLSLHACIPPHKHLDRHDERVAHEVRVDGAVEHVHGRVVAGARKQRVGAVEGHAAQRKRVVSERLGWAGRRKKNDISMDHSPALLEVQRLLSTNKQINHPFTEITPCTACLRGQGRTTPAACRPSL